MKCFYTKASILSLFIGLTTVVAQSQITFVNASSRLSTSNFNSGVGISVVDMNGDGLDDIARMNQGNALQIQTQRTGLPFAAVNGVSMGSGSAWSMVVGDVNEDGYKDAIAGFGSSAKLAIANGAGTGFNAASTLPNSNYFLQNMNCMDVDNDGDVDIFGCNDVGESKIWVNNGSGTFTVSNIINFNVTPNIPGNESTDDSGNYGSIWSDFDNDGDVDFYIAKCRQGVNSSSDPRRINLLFINNGNGTYTENAAAYGLKIGAQSWTANFDDINNDGWFDVLITNHDVPTMLMLNDGTGHFTDINVGNAAGLNVNFTPYQSKMMDFDNDGWIDILISGSSGSSSSARLFRNNGNNTFTGVTTAFPTNGTIHSFGLGDLNHDGKMDIYAGYATGYTTPSSTNDILWLNSTENNNHFVTFNLQGTVSNRDALGARIFLYGAWGVQTREVRAGESYGTCNTFNLHFGLGSSTVIDSAVIKWPSGIVDKLFGKPVDQFITVIEGLCSSPNNSITAVGSSVLCAGQTVTLQAAAGTGYTYLWSNGATTQQTQVSTAGEYSVKVTSGSCSSISPIIVVKVSPDETPTIAATGNTKFCDGGSVTLDGPSGWSGYHWSNGGQSEDLVVTQSGTYTLTIDGSCQQWTSAPIVVTVLDPAEPVVTGGSVLNSGTVNLSATGTNLQWYDAPTNGNLLATGGSYTTPVINTTTTYYVQSSTVFPGNTFNTGQTSHSGTSEYSGSNSTNATTSFTVTDNCLLASVKVYTDTQGERLVQIKSGSTVVHSALVNIPVTTGLPGGSIRIDLDFNLTPGTYTIETDATTNNTNFGYAGPRLRRSNGGGVSYPYTVPNVISITGSSEGNSLFYYFYDWEIEHGELECVSNRVPVVATVYSDASINEADNHAGLNTYPNPTSGILNIKATKADMNGATLKVLDVTGKVVYAERNVNMVQDVAKTIDVTHLASGIYTIEIANGELHYNVKFIVR